METLVKARGRVLAVTPEATISEAAKIMRDHAVGAIVVVDGDEVVGILSERDIIARVVAADGDPASTAVGQAMTRRVISCAPGTSMERVKKLMHEHGIRHLPIVENGKAVGMISSRDVLAHELSVARAVMHRQNRILSDLERSYPGIARIKITPDGRVVI